MIGKDIQISWFDIKPPSPSLCTVEPIRNMWNIYTGRVMALFLFSSKKVPRGWFKVETQ